MTKKRRKRLNKEPAPSTEAQVQDVASIIEAVQPPKSVRIEAVQPPEPAVVGDTDSEEKEGG